MDRIYFEKFLSNDDLTEAEIEYMLLPDYWRQGMEVKLQRNY